MAVETLCPTKVHQRNTTILCNSDPMCTTMVQVMMDKEEEYKLVDCLAKQLHCKEAANEGCRAKMVEWSVQIVDYY